MEGLYYPTPAGAILVIAPCSATGGQATVRALQTAATAGRMTYGPVQRKVALTAITTHTWQIHSMCTCVTTPTPLLCDVSWI